VAYPGGQRGPRPPLAIKKGKREKRKERRKKGKEEGRGNKGTQRV